MVTLDKIYHASFVLKDVARKTDLIAAPRLVPDAQVYLKTENLQVTGSFKVRGAYYKISQLSEEERSHGIVACSAGNIAVYATSNRRHLIKETLEDRQGSDIHESDTRQELMSLAARFGLTVTFGQPDKSRFVQIVTDLAAQYGVEDDPEKLIVRAEAFAIRAGGRSPRVAKQFIELCKAGVLN